MRYLQQQRQSENQRQETLPDATQTVIIDHEAVTGQSNDESPEYLKLLLGSAVVLLIVAALNSRRKSPTVLGAYSSSDEDAPWEIFICKDDVQQGPFSLDNILEMLNEGSLQSTDLAYREGFSNWLPVAAILSPKKTPKKPGRLEWFSKAFYRTPVQGTISIARRFLLATHSLRPPVTHRAIWITLLLLFTVAPVIAGMFLQSSPALFTFLQTFINLAVAILLLKETLRPNQLQGFACFKVAAASAAFYILTLKFLGKTHLLKSWFASAAETMSWRSPESVTKVLLLSVFGVGHSIYLFVAVAFLLKLITTRERESVIFQGFLFGFALSAFTTASVVFFNEAGNAPSYSPSVWTYEWLRVSCISAIQAYFIHTARDAGRHRVYIRSLTLFAGIAVSVADALLCRYTGSALNFAICISLLSAVLIFAVFLVTKVGSEFERQLVEDSQ